MDFILMAAETAIDILNREKMKLGEGGTILPWPVKQDLLRILRDSGVAWICPEGKNLQTVSYDEIVTSGFPICEHCGKEMEQYTNESEAPCME